MAREGRGRECIRMFSFRRGGGRGGESIRMVRERKRKRDRYIIMGGGGGGEGSEGEGEEEREGESTLKWLERERGNERGRGTF